MNMKLAFVLFAVLSLHDISSTQIYKLSDSNPFNIRPKLVRDKFGRVYCFWLSDSSSNICYLCVDTSINNFTLCYRIFDSGIWSATKTVAGATNQWYFGYDVDADTSGNIWIARFVGPSVELFRNHTNSGFLLQATLTDSAITGQPFTSITISAIDSNSIWFDYHPDFQAIDPRWLYFFDGDVFHKKYFGVDLPFYEKSVNPTIAFKSSEGVSYFLRTGLQRVTHTGEPSYPYTELLSTIPGDSIIVCSKISNSTNSLAASGSSDLLYLFYMNQASDSATATLQLIDQHSKSIVKALSNLLFFPSALSKQGPILIAAKTETNKILMKGINDSVFYRTTALTDTASFPDTGRGNLSVLPESTSTVWIAWQGVLGGQTHIFAARTQIDMAIDTNVVLGIKSPIQSSANLQFELTPNYPNPFNPLTTFQYILPSKVLVRLAVYDLLGRQVASVVNEIQQPGLHTAHFDAAHLPSGAYFYRMTAGAYSKTRKLILVK